MKKRTIIFSLLSLALMASATEAQAPAQPLAITAIKAGRLIDPETNYYYLTYVMDSTPLRAIQAASNGIQLLNSGFTVIRDVGNNALYADTALRQAIEQGWLPGPTVIPSG